MYSVYAYSLVVLARVTICSAILSVTCALLGILISILVPKGTPVGSTIVAVDIAAFLIFTILARLGVGTRKA